MGQSYVWRGAAGALRLPVAAPGPSTSPTRRLTRSRATAPSPWSIPKAKSSTPSVGTKPRQRRRLVADGG